MQPDTTNGKVLFDQNAVRRLTTAHIRAFQDRRISEGRAAPDAAFDTIVAQRQRNLDTLPLDEATFGLDSLALIDLVMELTRFFNLQDSGVEDYLLVQRTVGEWVKLISHHFVLLGDGARLTFTTSGSTGQPKEISKPAAVLLEEVSALSEEIGAHTAKGGRMISAVAPQHIYGLIWGVLLPLRLNWDVIDRYKTSPLGTGKLSRTGDMILATPYLWEKFAEFGTHFAPGCLGITSGGPATQKTFAAAKATGIDNIIEIYGATETGGVGLRETPHDPYQLLPHLVQDGDGIRRRAGAEPLDLQDKIRWGGDGTFTINGRQDTTIQVAGTNVNLMEVEAVMKGIAAVKEVAIRLDGQRLKAFVVPEDGQTAAIESEIRSKLLKLPAVARPDQIRFGPRLPVTDTGKPADWDSTILQSDAP